jgi:hypothetical protein
MDGLWSRLPAVRLPAGVSHGLDGDSRSAPHLALPASAGTADGADEEQVSGLLMETGVEHDRQRLQNTSKGRESESTSTISGVFGKKMLNLSISLLLVRRVSRGRVQPIEAVPKPNLLLENQKETKRCDFVLV